MANTNNGCPDWRMRAASLLLNDLPDEQIEGLLGLSLNEIVGLRAERASRNPQLGQAVGAGRSPVR